VELAFRLPQRLKLADRRGKHLLKQVARRRLPAELLSLPKKGFTAPIGEWIRGPYAGRFRDQVLGAGSEIGALVDRAVVARYFGEHTSGARNRWYELWSVWVLEEWLRAQRNRRCQTPLMEVTA
jgi:asparagine synthase (glutamine-hydrolysing)